MMTNEKEVEDFLAHYGIPGMKWGKRKAAQIKSASRKATKGLANDVRENPREAKVMSRIKSDTSAAKVRLKNSGGSKTLANTKVVGRTIALDLLAGVAGNVAMNVLGSNPTARAAIGLGTAAVRATNLVVGTRDVINVSIQPGAKKK